MQERESHGKDNSYHTAPPPNAIAYPLNTIEVASIVKVKYILFYIIYIFIFINIYLFLMELSVVFQVQSTYHSLWLWHFAGGSHDCSRGWNHFGLLQNEQIGSFT